MARKTTKPPSQAGNEGFAYEVVSDANLSSDHSPSLTLRQVPIAARRLTRRFGLPPATAAAVAELAGMGVAQ